METLFILKDCSERNAVYGLLVVKARVPKREIQSAINNIKSKMNDELQSSFTINEHILPNLPWKTELKGISEIEV